MMKKDRNKAQKILLLVIAVLAVLLMGVLIYKAYELHQEKIQQEKWEVRHQEVQSELDNVQTQIQELAGDGEALQEFIDEKLNPAIVVPEPEAPGTEAPEEDGTNPESPEPEETTPRPISEDGAQETMASGDNAIIVPEPEPPKPKTEKVISENAVPAEEPEEIVSENAVPAEEEPEEIVSENAVPVEEPEEIVSENAVPVEEEPEEIVSENAVPAEEEPEEIVSGNAVPAEEETEGTISGNAIVDGKVIPFRYEEHQLTLEERRSQRSSYEETLLVNEADKNVIAGNTYDFSGMKIACIGDSLTEGSNLENLENYKQYSYPSVLRDILNAKEGYNLGIGGSSYGRYWDQAFVDRYREIPADSDIIIVMGGTNDGFAASEKELGSLEEKKPRTFYGDVDELMQGLLRDYPGAKIIFATPLPNVLHDYLRNQRDYLLPQRVFADAVKQLAAQYNIDVIDLYNSNILDTHDAQVISTYMPDGVHGNEDGYRVLAEHFASEIIQIMKREALYQSAVSANSVPAENPENSGIVSGNGMGGEILKKPEEILSEEEKAAEAKRTAENNRKAAEGALVVPTAEDGKAAEDSMKNSEENSVDNSTEDSAEDSAGQGTPGEKLMPPEEKDYEYGGEAIVIQ